ncbi:hypothetical protein C8R44DRAFT_985672 [Mycena epipterygia]|nr:hypothetical protein C8R44DRAFT_985672 [Mycena epipterygia]
MLRCSPSLHSLTLIALDSFPFYFIPSHLSYFVSSSPIDVPHSPHPSLHIRSAVLAYFVLPIRVSSPRRPLFASTFPSSAPLLTSLALLAPTKSLLVSTLPRSFPSRPLLTLLVAGTSYRATLHHLAILATLLLILPSSTYALRSSVLYAPFLTSFFPLVSPPSPRINRPHSRSPSFPLPLHVDRPSSCTATSVSVPSLAIDAATHPHLPHHVSPPSRCPCYPLPLPPTLLLHAPPIHVIVLVRPPSHDLSFFPASHRSPTSLISPRVHAHYSSHLHSSSPIIINVLSLLHPVPSPLCAASVARIITYAAFVARIIKSANQQASIFLQQKRKVYILLAPYRHVLTPSRWRVGGAGAHRRRNLCTRRGDDDAPVYGALVSLPSSSYSFHLSRFGNWAVQRCLEAAAAAAPWTSRPATCGCHVRQKALDCEEEDVRLLVVSKLLMGDPAQTCVNKHAWQVWSKIMERSWIPPAPPIFAT